MVTGKWETRGTFNCTISQLPCHGHLLGHHIIKSKAPKTETQRSWQLRLLNGGPISAISFPVFTILYIIAYLVLWFEKS